MASPENCRFGVKDCLEMMERCVILLSREIVPGSYSYLQKKTYKNMKKKTEHLMI